MSKQSKKATKKKKADKKIKKKKQAKKFGLLKFLPDEKAKLKKPKPDEQSDDQPTVKRRVVNHKRQAKDLSLVDRCKLQMSSSILRLVDEKLYTCSTSNASLDEEEFKAYHEAYNKASESWPVKPIEFIVKFIKKRLFPKRPAHKFKFADVGCGQEPKLKMRLPPKAKVQSFDLVSNHKDVVAANMEKLPLDNESVHCAVYSLSLMARNLGHILLEAKRILKIKGSLLIVEVTSRFEGREKRFVAKVERLGFKKQSMTTLKPNAYFTFFHFTKLDDKFDYPNAFLNIELKPCIYKAR